MRCRFVPLVSIVVIIIAVSSCRDSGSSFSNIISATTITMMMEDDDDHHHHHPLILFSLSLREYSWLLVSPSIVDSMLAKELKAVTPHHCSSQCCPMNGKTRDPLVNWFMPPRMALRMAASGFALRGFLLRQVVHDCQPSGADFGSATPSS